MNRKYLHFYRWITKGKEKNISSLDMNEACQICFKLVVPKEDTIIELCETLDFFIQIDVVNNEGKIVIDQCFENQFDGCLDFVPDSQGIYQIEYTIKGVIGKKRFNSQTNLELIVNGKELSNEFPVLKKIDFHGSFVKLEWNSFENAEKYRIFRKNPGDNWKKIADVSSDITSYTDNRVQIGNQYIYTVRCMSSDGKRYTSQYDKNGLHIKCLDQPVLDNISKIEKGILIKWNLVENASQYRVFRKTKESVWVRIADVPSNICEYLDEITDDNAYFYTVRCLSTDKKSYESGYDKNGQSYEADKL